MAGHLPGDLDTAIFNFPGKRRAFSSAGESA